MSLERKALRALTFVLAASSALEGAEAPDAARARALVSEAQLAFEPNLGQAAADVSFIARGLGYSLTLSPSVVRFRFDAGRSAEMTLVNASSGAAAFQQQPLARSVSYFIGNQPDRWISGAPAYRRAGFRGVYPGIDVVYYTRDGRLEYDFELDPGADPAAIELGLSDARFDSDGALTVGRLRHQAPVAYQRINGERVEIAAGFERRANGSIGFRLGEYDPESALTIDPLVGLSTYLGGSETDRINGIRMTAEGDVWVVGETSSIDFPLPPRGFPAELGGESDIFAAKLERSLDAAGAQTWEITSTVFIGGDGRDRAVAVDFVEDDKVLILGDTNSADYPVTQDAWQAVPGGGFDSFITILRRSEFPLFPLAKEQRAPSNYVIDHSTFVGGLADDRTLDGFVGPFGEGQPCVGFAGLTESDDFPTVGLPLQPGKSGGTDAFFNFFCPDDPSAQAPYSQSYGTLLGGDGDELASAVAVDASGAFCLALQTPTSDLEATGVQPESAGEDDIYVTCQEPIRRTFGRAFLYREIGSTYFGGSIDESLGGIAVIQGAAERFGVIVALTSESLDIARPAELGAPPAGALEANPGLTSVALVGFDAALSSVRTQFWVGGRADDRVGGIATRGDCLALAGATQSADLLLTQGFPQEQHAGLDDLLISKMCFDQDLAATFEYSGFYGSPAREIGVRIALGPGGNEIAAGLFSLSTLAEIRQGAPSFPTSDGAPQTTFGGGIRDGFLVELYRPMLRPEALTGAADFRPGPLAPGQIVTLFVAGVGANPPVGATFDELNRLPTQVGPTRVFFDGVPAPMLFSALNQTSVIAPFFLENRTEIDVEVEVLGVRSLPVRLAVEATSPAVFTLDQSGQGQGAILNQDFTVNGPATPAAAGSVVQIFLTGGGQTVRPGVDGEVVPVRQPFPVLLAPVTATIGGLPAETLFQGAAPGLVHGVVQINARISSEHPPSVASPLAIEIGGRAIQPGVTLAVQ